MSQQIDNDNVQDSTFTSKRTPKQPEPEPVLEAKVVEKTPFLDRWKTNRFWLVRGSYYVLRSVWMIVMGIGMFIAWLISFLFI